MITTAAMPIPHHKAETDSSGVFVVSVVTEDEAELFAAGGVVDMAAVVVSNPDSPEVVTENVSVVSADGCVSVVSYSAGSFVVTGTSAAESAT